MQLRTKRIGRICVFCGSNSGKRKVFAEGARTLARHMAAREIDLVFGGGRVGLMGILADEMLLLGREATGVIPYALAEREVAHMSLTDLRVVHTMHERKALMSELSDAFIAIPGGFGTFEELFEVITWAQLGIHEKPIGILNIDHFFDPFEAMISTAIEEGFIRPEYTGLLVVENDVETLLGRLDLFEPVNGVTKWVDLVES